MYISLHTRINTCNTYICVLCTVQVQEIPEDTIQNMGTHGSITGKTMMRIICFDHITTATTPLPNRYRMKRTSYNHKVIYT